MSQPAFSHHVRLKYRLLIEGVHCVFRGEGTAAIRFSSGISAYARLVNGIDGSMRCRLERHDDRYVLITEESEVPVQCHLIEPDSGLLKIDQNWLCRWRHLGANDEARILELQRSLSDAVFSDMRMQSIHLICMGDQDEANLAAVQVVADCVRRHFCIPIHVTLPLLHTEEGLDAFARWGVDVVVFRLPQMARRQQSRFEVEQMFSKTIRLLKRARDILPVGSMAVQLQAETTSFDSLKTDLEILIRLGLTPLLGFDQRQHLLLAEEVERFIELAVFLHHRSVAVGLSDVLFRHLRDVIFPSEGQYLEPHMSKIKKAMMNLPRTDILSRRPASRLVSDRKTINWG